MCVICKRYDVGYSVDGLDGGICEQCNTALLALRQGNAEYAKNYFKQIDISSESNYYIKNAFLLQNIENTSFVDEKPDPVETNVSVHELTEAESNKRMSDDIRIIKNILIFFLVVFCISLICSIWSVWQISSFFKDLF